ncbi:flagellar basal body-associated FliL family protein [Alloalcanivorax marinus]|uniref:flagellar basal body-associated FliL family protein n=1 Tax=Alloalcanivorax marinus TaxID=1177169 RepID=UPI00193197CD|nr:flagellar basal body-associated FliL family protein [Alloalcanivorax marinus]MBL7251712.1 flagellar basal body-associated protein FliL [Alloalcanivorax marinus]
MADSPKRSRKTGVLIALMVVLVAALVAVNLYLLLGNDDAPSPEAETSVDNKTPEPTRLVRLDPFTVNIQGELCGQRLLYVGLSLEVADAATESYLLEHLPQLRSRLLMLLSSQDSETAATVEGKHALARQVLASFEEPLTASQPDLAVRDVLFTEFIVQ